MKRILLTAFAAATFSGLSASLNLSLNYGSGLVTTSSTISFNYNAVCSNTTSYFTGHLLATVYLDNGTNSYFIGQFVHMTGNCSSTTAIVGPPSSSVGSVPYQSLTITNGCTALQTVTFNVPAGCYPNGTYNIRVQVEGIDFGIEMDGAGAPSCDIFVGSSYFPQAMTYGFPYAHATWVDANANIGTYTLTTGGPFSVSFGSIATTCSSSGAVALTITPGSPNYMIWTTPYGSPQITYSTSPVINKPAGTYPVIVVDAAGCRRDGSVTVAPPTMPTVTASKSPAQPGGGYCKMTCITLNATPSTGTGYTYQWKRNGTNINTNQSFCNMPGVSPTTTTYSVTISNAFGCTASGTVTALTNTSCTGATAACCLGPRREMYPGDSSLIAIQVFPNPATEVVNVQFAEPATYGTILEFTDITGKVVRHVEVPEGATCYTMDVNDLPAGVYLANVFEQETKIISTEFVVE